MSKYKHNRVSKGYSAPLQSGFHVHVKVDKEENEIRAWISDAVNIAYFNERYKTKISEGNVTTVHLLRHPNLHIITNADTRWMDIIYRILIDEFGKNTIRYSEAGTEYELVTRGTFRAFGRAKEYERLKEIHVQKCRFNYLGEITEVNAEIAKRNLDQMSEQESDMYVGMSENKRAFRSDNGLDEDGEVVVKVDDVVHYDVRDTKWDFIPPEELTHDLNSALIISDKNASLNLKTMDVKHQLHEHYVNVEPSLKCACEIRPWQQAMYDLMHRLGGDFGDTDLSKPLDVLEAILKYVKRRERREIAHVLIERIRTQLDGLAVSDMEMIKTKIHDWVDQKYGE